MAAASAATAAEAAKSSAAVNPDSYIGSLISLTSKSDIRYEGVLYSINTEESTIGLRNVRSFGTEGRKMDGPQIPAGDKIYEYILFRGTDIRELQVKSAPQASQTTSVQNDPAIIQTHYSHPAPTSSSSDSTGIRIEPDIAPHSAQPGIQRQPFPGNIPLYQPGAGILPWNSSPAPPTANGSGLGMPPMYWQGYFAPSGGFPHLQQPQALFRPPPGLAVPPPLPYTGLPSLPASFPNLTDLTSQMQPASSQTAVTLPLAPASASFTSLSMPSSSANQLPNKPSSNPVSVPSVSYSVQPPVLRVATSLPANPEPVMSAPQSQSKLPVISSSKSTVVSSAATAQRSVSQSAPINVASSSSTEAEKVLPLVTPGQFFLPGTSANPLNQSSEASQMETEVKQQPEAKMKTSLPEPSRNTITESKDSSVPLSQSSQAALRDTAARRPEARTRPLLHEPPRYTRSGNREPLLPAPRPTFRRPSGAPPSYAQYNNRGGYVRGRGRGRGRGNGYLHSVTRFTEDFDFTAMNEKFNKDEVWGHLGKSKGSLQDGDSDEEYGAEDDEDEHPNSGAKPVYVKDDFFDSLSTSTLDNGGRNGRTRFSEQLKIDAETFGDFARRRSMPMRGGQQGQGRGRGAPPRGRVPHNGRGGGYGYGGRSLGNHY